VTLRAEATLKTNGCYDNRAKSAQDSTGYIPNVCSKGFACHFSFRDFCTPVLKQVVLGLASYIMLCNRNLRQSNIWFRSGT